MGDVYRAFDARLNREVAVKVLPESLAADPDRLRRFEIEARAASALNHPAIVTVYDFGHAGGRAYLVMELVPGETLRSAIANGSLTMRRSLAIAAQVADAMAKAHDAGIVHRDLKPENIMVTPDGFAKVLDFGLAKLIVAAQHDAETRTGGTDAGTVLGTAGYMSPEQALGKPADHRSDQFSFGAVLYEMVTGTKAFDKSSSVETLSAIVRDDVAPIETVRPDTPLPLSWIAERCLSKDPGDRYASTRDLARDLAQARDRLSTSTPKTTAVRSRALATWRVREAAAWMLVVILGGVAVRSLFQQPQVARNPVTRFTFAAPPNTALMSALASPPFAVSPDGTQIAFLAVNAEGARSLWVRAIDALQPRPIAGTDGALGPFWSADGRHIAFFARGELKRVPAGGGEPVTIASNVSGAGGTWNAQDVIVFAGGLDDSLSRVSANGGAVTELTSLEEARSDGGHNFPVFLPDGNHFLFKVMSADHYGVYVASLDAPTPRRISEVESMVGYGAGHVFFVKDRTLMAQRFDETALALEGDPIRVAADVEGGPGAPGFAVAASGTIVYWPGTYSISQPTWLSRDGRVLSTLGPPGAYGQVSLSPDETQIAIDRFDDNSIWRMDLRGVLTRVTANAIYQSTPLWSPDGGSIIYTKFVHTPPNLFRKFLDRDEEVRLFFDRLQAFPQAITPDGRYVLFSTIHPQSGTDIWHVDLQQSGADGFARRPLLVTPFNESMPQVSPDGRWLAFMSNESRNAEIYVAPLWAPARKQRVSTAGGRAPRWSKDGRELYYIDRVGHMAAVTVGEGGSAPRLGTPVSLFDAKVPSGLLGMVTSYDVTRDGRFLALRFVERTSPPATVILNWTAPASAQN